MRQLSELERQIVHVMIAVDDSAGFSALHSVLVNPDFPLPLPEHWYVRVSATEDVVLKIPEESVSRSGPVSLQLLEAGVYRSLLTLVSLLKDLEEERLVHFTGEYDLEDLGTVVNGEPYQDADLLDSDVQELLRRYARRRFLVSESLRMLAAHGFRSEEDRRRDEEIAALQRQANSARRALYIAVVGVIAASIVPATVAWRITSSVRVVDSEVRTSFTTDTKATLEDLYQSGVATASARLGSLATHVEGIEDVLRKNSEPLRRSNDLQALEAELRLIRLSVGELAAAMRGQSGSLREGAQEIDSRPSD